MRKQITGDKLERLNYLFENESNAKELSDALIAKSITGATASNVKEVGGSHLEYRFRLAADTETSWLKKRAIRITKKFIEDYNQALQGAYDAAVVAGLTPEEPDFDSDETHIAQATAWIRQSVKGTKHEIDSGVDKVEIVALSGKVDEANFLIEVQEAGLVADHGKKHQQRIKLERLNIADFIPEEGITVTTLDHAGATLEILAALNLPEALEGEEFEIRRLFLEDILLPMTHLKDGHRYVAVISSAALDYYGEIQFSVAKEPENSEPVYPSMMRATYDTNMGVVGSDGTGNSYLLLDEFDPLTRMIIASSPNFGISENLFSTFSIKLYNPNGSNVEIFDSWSNGHDRQISYSRPNTNPNYDNNLTAFKQNDYYISVTGDTVSVSIVGTVGDQTFVESREYIVEGIGVPAGQKMLAQISLQWYSEQLQNVADLNSKFYITPKEQ